LTVFETFKNTPELQNSPSGCTDTANLQVRMSAAGTLNFPTPKPFIVSVTGKADEVARCYALMAKTLSERKEGGLMLMMEINLSCPNIPDKPPPAYDSKSLAEYIAAIGKAQSQAESENHHPLHVGIKTPPYTYHGQFEQLINVLEAWAALHNSCPISFITATNTLGSCLVLQEDGKLALGSVNGEGIGGMAGDALHPLALGNVKTIRTMLNASVYPEVRNITIIGTGGVSDAAGFTRMRSVGETAVGVGTALGRQGVAIFTKITEGLPE
jgi:dihydroorotate dehydrogenase (fumarate)